MNDHQLEQTLRTLAADQHLNRRGFLQGLGLAGSLATLALSGCTSQAPTDVADHVATVVPPRMRAAFSHNGLNTIWNQRGRDTARQLGKLLGIDVVSYDGELNVDKQRQDLQAIAADHWDFVVVHPLAVNAYADVIREISAKGIPVIDIDTRLADNLDGLGVTTFLEADNVWMAEQVTQAIIDAAATPTFEIVHTQGLLTHTGAQNRAQGFRNILARHPGIRVVDETPCDWNIDKVTSHWGDLLEQFPNIRAGFFHNDEMALAALRAITLVHKQKQIIVGGIDGMQPACEAVLAGDMVATAINPTGRIHGSALWVGYIIASQGQRDHVPPFIRIDGGIVTRDNAAGFRWLGDHFLI